MRLISGLRLKSGNGTRKWESLLGMPSKNVIAVKLGISKKCIKIGK